MSQKFEGLFACLHDNGIHPNKKHKVFMLKLEMETLEIRIAKCTYICASHHDHHHDYYYHHQLQRQHQHQMPHPTDDTTSLWPELLNYFVSDSHQKTTVLEDEVVPLVFRSFAEFFHEVCTNDEQLWRHSSGPRSGQ